MVRDDALPGFQFPHERTTLERPQDRENIDALLCHAYGLQAALEQNAERVRGKWTIYVCPCHQWPDPQAEDDECLTCGHPIERIRVVDASVLDELEKRLDWIERDRREADKILCDLQSARSLIRSHRGSEAARS